MKLLPGRTGDGWQGRTAASGVHMFKKQTTKMGFNTMQRGQTKHKEKNNRQREEERGGGEAQVQHMRAGQPIKQAQEENSWTQAHRIRDVVAHPVNTPKKFLTSTFMGP